MTVATKARTSPVTEVSPQSRHRNVPGWLAWPLRLLAGVLLSQHPLTSLLIVGWTWTFVRKNIQNRWGTEGLLRNDLSEPAPGWFRSIWDLLRTGVAAVTCTWLVTWWGMGLWALSWQTGWNTSFFKLYEHSEVGASLGLLGSLLFILSMFYVPFAQARHASAGDWNAFFDFPVIVRLVRRNGFSALRLAAAFAVLGLPILWIRMVPTFLPQIDPRLEEFSDAELLRYLKNYYLLASFLLVPAYVFLHRLSGRLYAKAILREVRRTGDLTLFHPAERERLDLDRLEPAAPPIRWRVARGGLSFASAVSGGGCLMAAFLLWFAVVTEVYIGQFFNYIPPWPGWLNHPFVHLPWLRYLPPGL